MRVLVAGFKHETNTFAPDRADWSAFEMGEAMPPAIRGQAMIDLVMQIDIPMTGFLKSARSRGWTTLPSLWCGAVPSSYVTADAFERICGTIVEDARKGGFDAIYLDLHGAAVAETADDAEGELLRRLRAVVGDDLPIVASLDLHSNTTDAMLDLADGLVAYRTYPHVDYVETGALAAELLERRVRRGRRETIARQRLPFLIPLNAQCTTAEPARTIFQTVRELDDALGTMLSFCMGFPASDFTECAPMIWGYGDQAATAVDRVASLAGDAGQWRQEVHEPRQAVVVATGRTEATGRPVVIADTQDNPGAGGTGSTTGMLRALLAEKAGEKYPGRVAIGMICDKAAAAAAASVGVGGRLDIEVGTAVPTFGGQSDPPVKGSFVVRAVGDGRITFKGPKMTGFVTELGPSACLEIDGVLVVVASGKIGTQDRELFRALGVAPEEMRIIIVKSSMHFRADFEPLVADQERDIIVAKAPGALAADPADLPWKKLPASIRRSP